MITGYPVSGRYWQDVKDKEYQYFPTNGAHCQNASAYSVHTREIFFCCETSENHKEDISSCFFFEKKLEII